MSNNLRGNGLTEKNKKVIALIVVAVFIVFCAVVTWFIGKPLVDFVSEPEKFRAWVQEYGFWGKICFVGMVFFQVVIALVPGEAFEIGAGYAFGIVEGTILCEIGITLGSLVVFFMVRKFGVKLVEVFFSREKINSLKFLKDEKKRNAITFLVFFLPGTPKDLLTYFVGLTDIKASHFLLLASIARLPSVITSVVGGDALGGKDYVFAVIVFVVTLLFSGAGVLIYNLISKKRNKN